jgi:hypothetical protein
MSLAHAQSLLANTMSSVMQRTMEQRRQYTEAHANALVRDGVAQGIVELEGSGETIVDVLFPIRFSELPIFAPGLELRGNASLQMGDLPVWSATVGRWITENVSNSTLYAGATIGIVTFNAPRANFHYSFAGRSYVTPVDSSNSVTQTL